MTQFARAKALPCAQRGPSGTPLNADSRAVRATASPSYFLLRTSYFLLLLLLPACHVDRTLDVTGSVTRGDYGQARMFVRNNLHQNRRDREFLLDRMQLGVLTLADGHAKSAQGVFEEVYEVLRTQGVNADKTVASVVINEDVKLWKGEPFEQALALAYYGLQQGSLGQWDNVRAAAGNSLFQLRDFGNNKQGERIDTLEIAQRAIEYEQKQAGKPSDGKDYFNTGYAVRESNFTLGYILHGLASQALGRGDEARDFFNVAAQVDQNVRPLVDALKTGQYNTVLVVSHGLGPAKIAYGPDNALAKFQPRYPSDRDPLIVRAGGSNAAFPVVCDVNAMATDHMWNNLEDVRHAKSVVGTGLLAAGAITTAVGIDRKNNTAALVGIGLMAAGALAKAGAHADTRYCNVLPQRLYVVPINIPEPNSIVEVQVQGRAGSRMALAGLSPPPRGQTLQLRYVSLVSGARLGDSYSPQWASSGRIFYSTNQTGPLPGAPSPIVLGGNDARTPSADLLPEYQQHPNLRFATPAELEGVYRGQGVLLTTEDQGGYAGLHVLEGGKSLVEPLAGTAGFMRIFGQPHTFAPGAPGAPASQGKRKN